MSVINKQLGTRIGARKTLRVASSLVVLTATLASQNMLAQESQENEVEEVIVEGTRGSLQSAQEIKRDAQTFVDAVSASDIGALPDRSVLEAMQRIPGVSIERFAASDDPDHFGVEGSGVVVRGMTQTRAEFNGRDTFTASDQRGLSFQDVPPGLLKSVRVYKNQTADMVEGGIAATVDLVTRKPFDTEGSSFSINADVTYGDMAQQYTPTYSGIFSNRWDTDLGEFGFLINASDSELKVESHGIQSDRYELRGLDAPYPAADGEDPLVPGIDVATPYIYDGSFGRGVSDRQPRTNADGSQLFCVDSNAAGAPAGCTNKGAVIPNGAIARMKHDTRVRKGFASVLQWQSEDETLLVTAEFLRSQASLSWRENVLKPESDYASLSQWYQPYGGTDYGFDSEGVFTHGLLTNIARDWRGDGDRVPHSADWSGAPVQYFGIRYAAETRDRIQESDIQDKSFNIDWKPTDNLDIEADIQYVDATSNIQDYSLMFGTNMNEWYDTRGGTPSLTIYSPWSLATDEELDGAATNAAEWAAEESYFSQPTSYWHHAALDHAEDAAGNSLASSLDVTYHFDDGFITAVKAGARHAKREQLVKSTEYSWGSLGPIWQDDGTFLDQYPTNIFQSPNTPVYEEVDWSDFQRGGVLNFDGPNNISLHPSAEMMNAYNHWDRYYDEIAGESCDDWHPLDQRINPDKFLENGECANVRLNDLNGNYRDNEITDSTEENNAFYVRADFELDLDIRIAGNIGVRYVTIESTSRGHTLFPDLRPGRAAPSGFNPYTFDPSDTSLYPDPANDLPYDLYDDSSAFLGDAGNFLPAEWRDFANGVSTVEYAAQRYSKTLPSLNIKAEFSPELVGRFAVSKAIALPDMGDMRNYTHIKASNFDNGFLTPVFTAANPHPDAPVGSPTGNPVDDSGAELSQQSIVDVNDVRLSSWNADAGNPFLKPMESTQFDISLEWYFGDASSLTGSLFYRDLNNFFIQGADVREYTNPSTGQSQPVVVVSKMNGGEGTMQGFEINYQQYFDNLPAPFDGLGTQINYTYVDAVGVPNQGRSVENSYYEDIDTLTEYTNSEEIGLEGQSDHTLNFILMYQKGDFDTRLAYNWRSEYLVSSYDVITRLPIYNDSYGSLDASMFYEIADGIKVGLQGVNLLNAQTKTYQLVDDEHKLGRSWFVNDRRYSLLVRASF